MKLNHYITLIILTISAIACEDGTDGTNGQEGKKSLVNLDIEAKGANCSTGGLKITSGIDVNNNNILEESEIQNTKYVCNGNDGAYDKQITLKLFDFVTSSNTEPLESITKYNYGYGGIVKFNIQNYINIDSATLVAYDLKTRDGYYGNNVPGTIKLELYDCKNSQIIKGSEIISGEITEGSSVSSNNFIENLPNEDIELGVKLTKSSNFYASTSDIILILKRK